MPQKTVLITGCSDGGIGAALAAEFQLRGLRVFATARDRSKMASLEALGIETLALDVTSEESIEQAVAEVQKRLNNDESSTWSITEPPIGLDFLINNAGVNHIMPFSDAKLSDLRLVIDTNIMGVLAVTQAFIPLLMRDKAVNTTNVTGPTGNSTVAMLGSVNEVFSPPYQAAYNASKAAVHALAKTLRVELAPLGINCVTLMTGSVRSKLFDNAPSQVPETSFYSAVADKIEGRDFLKNAQWVDTDEFAKQVVSDLLRPKPRLDIWRGGLARVASWLAWLGWEGMLDSAMLKANNLNEIQPYAHKARTERSTTEHDLDVLIVGGGPAGTMLALELAAQGVSFRVVDKAPQRSDKSRAIIIQPRSFEMMNRHGIAHKLYKKGNPSGGPLCWLNNKPIVDVNIKTVANYKDSEFALPCLLSQAETEGYLDECLRERYGREIEHGIEAESILQDREGVNVILRNVNEGTKEEIRAKYVIGADGAHSIVRKSSGNIKFDGGTYAQEFIMCDGMIEGFTLSPDRYHLVLGNGLLIVFPMARGWFRVMASRGAFSSAAEPTLEEMQTVLGNKLPGGGKITNTTWVTNFRLHHRIVDSYRDARLFVIGDAAHLHSPVGGQGLNTSLQDAVNLGWKLARAARGDGDRDGDGDGLLDSFDAERRPIGQELLAKTDRTFTMLSLTNRLAVCLRNVLVPWVAPYITSPGALSHIYGFMSQFAINYRESAIVHTGTAFTGPVLAGDRAPDGDIYDDGVDGEGVAKRLYGILAPDSYYLVLFASSSSADSGSELEELERVAARFGDINTDKARVHIIVQERDGRHIYSEKLYDHYGFTSPGYAYIRPDYYVASIGNLEHVDEFLGWLK